MTASTSPSRRTVSGGAHTSLTANTNRSSAAPSRLRQAANNSRTVVPSRMGTVSSRAFMRSAAKEKNSTRTVGVEDGVPVGEVSFAMRTTMYWYWIVGFLVFVAAAAALLLRPAPRASMPRPGPLTAHWTPRSGQVVGIDAHLSVTVPLAVPVARVRRALRLSVPAPVTVAAAGPNRFVIAPRHAWPASADIVARLSWAALYPRLARGGWTVEDVHTDDGRRLVVDLTTQRLYAYENNRLVRTLVVSTGVPPRYATPTGMFWIWRRVAVDRMRGGRPGEPDSYDVPHVPWSQYIVGGVAIHGAWWARRFGVPQSHGCIQLATRTFNPHPEGVPEDAGWVWQFAHLGTPVTVIGTTPRRAAHLLAYPPPARRSASSATSCRRRTRESEA
jgi:hypothetical protein